MDAKYFEEIKAREQAATPGPWKLLTRGNTVKSLAIERVCGGMKFIDRSDASFIAHTRTDIPALISALREAQDENAKLIAEVENSHNEIATLKKALELACERNAEYAFCGGTDAMKAKHAEKNFHYYIQQAQKQEGVK